MFTRMMLHCRFTQFVVIIAIVFIGMSSIISAQNEPKAEKNLPEGAALFEQGLISRNKIIVQSNHSASERKIFETLQRQTTFEFPGNPLSDVMEYLSNLHQIPIQIDKFGLNKIGIKEDHEIELIMSNTSLDDALRLLLEPHSLDYIVKNGSLIVTTTKVAEAYNETRVYNVRALKLSDPEVLADVIIHTTGNESWNQYSGTGNLSFFKGSFIIKQNQKTHSEIEALLNLLLNDLNNSDESPEWSVKDRSNDKYITGEQNANACYFSRVESNLPKSNSQD